MRRYNIVNGDLTTVKGTVVAVPNGSTLMGRDLAMVGDQVICPKCKTTGHIVADGPRSPGFFMGRAEALDRDICMCACPVKPRLINSLDSMCQTLSVAEAVAQGFASWVGMKSNADGSSESEEIIEQYFELVDEHGTPVEGYRYDLFADGAPIKEAGDFSSGRTIAHNGNSRLEIVFWSKKTGEV